MPILDYNDELTWTSGATPPSKQTVVGNFGTAIIGGRVKDAGRARDWGAGEPKFFYLRFVTALAGATGGLQVDLVGADNAALTTNPVVLSTKTIALAAALVNTVHQLPVLAAGSNKRYFGVKLTPLTANSTTGEVIVGEIDESARPQDGAVFM